MVTQKQVSIKKNDHDLLNKVKNYQKNKNNLLALKALCRELETLVSCIIDNRIERWPP